MNIVRKTHIGAYAVIINDDKIALVKKARGGYKGKLDLPGGGIEHDETVVEALFRECNEEVGGEVNNYKLLEVLDITFKWQMEVDLIEDLHHIGIIYIVDLKNNNLRATGDGLDSNGGIWVEIDKITEEMVSPFTWMSLKKLGYK